MKLIGKGNIKESFDMISFEIKLKGENKMGRDLYISCKDCKEKMWVGQNKRFYSNEQIIEFLDRHIGHSLMYCSDYSDCIEDIEEYVRVDIDFNKGEK